VFHYVPYDPLSMAIPCASQADEASSQSMALALSSATHALAAGLEAR
jgi:hypothetical protein